jgi:hypothetical protein
MTNQHPITPPIELAQQWLAPWGVESDEDPNQAFVSSYRGLMGLIDKAAQWGADQELEACCETLDMVNGSNYWSQVLRSGRRLKLPSLKEQALSDLNILTAAAIAAGVGIDSARIRQALEQLDD